jgi:hypothetical protein
VWAGVYCEIEGRAILDRTPKRRGVSPTVRQCAPRDVAILMPVWGHFSLNLLVSKYQSQFVDVGESSGAVQHEDVCSPNEFQ